MEMLPNFYQLRCTEGWGGWSHKAINQIIAVSQLETWTSLCQKLGTFNWLPFHITVCCAWPETNKLIPFPWNCTGHKSGRSRQLVQNRCCSQQKPGEIEDVKRWPIKLGNNLLLFKTSKCCSRLPWFDSRFCVLTPPPLSLIWSIFWNNLMLETS